MKLVKLDYRHTLKRKGYNYAFVFTTYSKKQPSEHTVERIVRKAEGLSWYGHTHYGKSNGNRRPYYIGFNRESTATMVYLQTGS